MLGVCAVVVLGSVGGAEAKKGGGKSPAVTRTAAVPIAPGAQVAATANCAAKTHITGGGYSVSPAYNAGGSNVATAGTGTRINHLQSQSGGTRSWIAGAAAFTTPAQPGTFTSYARCEKNSAGKLAGTISGTSTIPVGQGTTVNLNCPGGTHVIAGGFAGSPAGNLGAPTSFRLIIAESRRLNTSTWEVRAVNPTGSLSVATLATNAVCERNGTSVTERSVVAPILDNNRTSATATCSKKGHMVGGGFLVSPTTSPSPAVGVDQSQPSGQRSWLVGLYEYPTFALPPGSTLTAYSYCKKN
jgi:hypothetical protein